METYEGREPYIFISYARTDGDKVTPFLDALSKAGYRFWYDASAQAGADWLEILLGKVAACAVFCPLFSDAFKDSHYCYEETEWAYQNRKTIVPVYLEELTRDSLRLFYQRLLQSRQTLRLYDYADAAEFVETLGREQAFAPCKKPEWHKIGQIQWRFSESDGVLSIARNEDLPDYMESGTIPPYQFAPVGINGTAPWALYREKILSVVIEDDIDAIGDCAFVHCNRLMEVRIPDSVTEIGDFAFAGCQMMEVRIPDSVTKIGDFAFAGCQMTEVRIPDSVTEIGASTFADCGSLTKVRIPDSVTKIGDGAFLRCKMTNVHIPDSVSKIGDFAFAGCESLKSVEIPAGAEVGYKAFPEHTRVICRDAPEQ